MSEVYATNFRRLVLVTHRWLGLAASVALVIVAMTGFIIAWPHHGRLPRLIGALHENLAFGRLGSRVVVAATIAGVILQLGGLFLWWKQKTFWVRTGAGWRRAVTDLHHMVGVLTLPIMFVLGSTAVGMSFMTPRDHPVLRPMLADLHTTRKYSTPIKLVYMVGSTGFFVQGASGVAMWWSTRRRFRLP
jgi:uncharacterized iron-regulated membrane protein